MSYNCPAHITTNVRICNELSSTYSISTTITSFLVRQRKVVIIITRIIITIAWYKREQLLTIWNEWMNEYMYLSLKCAYHQKILFSHLILHFMQWTSAKKFFDLDKKRFCYECLKTWKSYFLAVDPYRWLQHRHVQSCDVVAKTLWYCLVLHCIFSSVNAALCD